jgi:hypothetical protein
MRERFFDALPLRCVSALAREAALVLADALLEAKQPQLVREARAVELWLESSTTL